jgi:acyl dehydratase
MLAFEDFPAGLVRDLGRKHVTREEVLSFAREFDPQPFHLDEAAARASILGGLAASGWHSCAMMMRLLYDGCLKETASLGSPGLEEVKWLKPVLVGDTIQATMKVLDARVSRSKPHVGILRILYEVTNQKGETVMTWDGVQLVRTRAGIAADADGAPDR